ncbi:MAG: restriction endonuclease subunit S, partial [Proteobacteria bacterium]|nr:restriction endonuclease subunit S [Pseudomonadota bacterium]
MADISSNDLWKNSKLGEMAEEVRNLFEPKISQEYPYIGLEHIDQGTLKLNSVGQSTDTVSTKKQFKSGEILFGSLRPYFRKVVRPKFNGVCSTDITVIRPKKNCNAGFLQYFIANQSFIDHATNISSGTRMPRANWKTLCESEWQFPPLFTQRKIAAILSAYDDLIENNLRRIRILEEMAQNLYREWFVKFRFPGHQHTRFTDSPLGPIPEEWEVKRLNQVVLFQNNGTEAGEHLSDCVYLPIDCI